MCHKYATRFAETSVGLLKSLSHFLYMYLKTKGRKNKAAIYLHVHYFPSDMAFKFDNHSKEIK